MSFDDNGRLVDVNGPLEYVDFGPPPPIEWVSVIDAPDAFGRRGATRNGSGIRYGLRIASEVFEDAGGWYVHLVGEDQWWWWIGQSADERPARPSHAICWPARYVWLELTDGQSEPNSTREDSRS
ncbi:hypothetical protein FHX74_001276 [Friedmanniella endophytica]|uniref:Uncharacterized protein n=1 Tax=Microlunatus kandeliicorticis TaxID=1759536 RepID=A0A7W3IR29_9ACTN|nr:hypothetical protein [Microlunatus kandeliicorticis]